MPVYPVVDLFEGAPVVSLLPGERVNNKKTLWFRIGSAVRKSAKPCLEKWLKCPSIN